MTILVFNLNPSDTVPILAEIIIYAGLAIPWGIAAIYRTRKGAPEGGHWLRLITSQPAFVTIFFIQLVGIAGTAVYAAVNFESLGPMGLLFGLLGGVLMTALAFVKDHERLSRMFAISVPLFSLVLILIILSSSLSWGQFWSRAPRIVVVPVVWYAWFAIPLGFIALAKELGIPSVELTRPKFDIKTALIGTAVLAVAFTIARPCFAFGTSAYLAGTLFTITVIGVAALLAYWLDAKEGSATPVRWTALGVAALLMLTIHTLLVVWYDGATDYGYVVVRTPEQVTLRVEHLASGRVDIREIDEDGQLLGHTRSGKIEVEVLNRDDLEAVPSKVDVLRATPMELRIERVASAGETR